MPPHVVLLSIALGVSSISHQRNAVRVMAMALFFLLLLFSDFEIVQKDAAIPLVDERIFFFFYTFLSIHRSSLSLSLSLSS